MHKENLFSFDVVSRVSFLVNAATLVTCSYQLHNTVTTLRHIADQLGLPIMFTSHTQTQTHTRLMALCPRLPG